jgi:replicative DNA helicase
MTETYQTGSEALATWRDDVLAGKPPELYPIGKGALSRIEVGPKLVTLIGGAPGAGKTALTMQAVIDALRIEMSPAALFDRQLARLSGIDLTTIRYRRLGSEHAKRITLAMDTLELLAERLCFVRPRPPFSLENIADTADEFGAKLLLLDYIQRIPPPGVHNDRRGSIDATMGYLRKFADEGSAIIVVSAVARSKDTQGRSSYDAKFVNLASFRESSELEFGADDAFILVSDKGNVTLKHLKARNGEANDIVLTFDKPRQHFGDAVLPAGSPSQRKSRKSDVKALWEKAQPAAEGS